MHKLKQSLVGLRLLSLQWSDSVGRFVMISCVAVIFFLLGVATRLIEVDQHAHLKVIRVHTQHVDVAPKQPAESVTTPIVPRIINGPPLLQQGADHTGQLPQEHRAGQATNAPAPDRTGLADALQQAGSPRTETETRDSVRCLKPAMAALLHAIEDRFGRVTIISTCRPGATIAGTDRPSRHRYGNAIDFVAPTGKKQPIVRWLIETHKTGGVMTYDDSDHIHVDIGPHFVSLAGERQRKRRARDDDD